MSRLDSCFSKLKQQNKTALIPFITAGDPHYAITVSLMHSMVEAGADIIELGIPFSDPMADGPVIQLSSERALDKGMSLKKVLEIVAEFRKQDTSTPIILMGYLNPIEWMGYEEFANAAGDAGVDGVLTVDMPPEESEELAPILQRKQIDPIFLIAPTSTEQRIVKIAMAARGFIYYVAVKGVTGSSALDVTEVHERIDYVRHLSNMPIGVGFGIKDAASAAAVAEFADGVVVGSAIVNRIAEMANDSDDKIIATVCELLSSMRTAMDKE